MWATITKPFAWLLLQYYELTGSYGWAIILFALTVNLVLMPFMAKSKKNMMRTSRLQPRLQELQKKHEGNQQKLNEETSRLYREEHINPMSGCLWSLIPFPILIALYSVIRQPLTRMLYMTEEAVATLQTFLSNSGWYTAATKTDAYYEIQLLQTTHEHWDAVMSSDIAGQLQGLQNIDFSFLGLNLGAKPQWNFFSHVDWGVVGDWLPALCLFLIPFFSAFMSWVSMKVSNMANPPDPKTQASMKSMNLVMPLMSIWICFIMPAALGIYWIANSLFGMIRDYVLTMHYKHKLDKEDEERLLSRSQREKELEEKRLETERLKAEGKTNVNANTSKKKMQAQERQEAEARRAAAEKAEREERRKRKGIKTGEKPDSQVGNRRYARGRAYVADRFGGEAASSTGEENLIPELDAEETKIPEVEIQPVEIPEVKFSEDELSIDTSVDDDIFKPLDNDLEDKDSDK